MLALITATKNSIGTVKGALDSASPMQGYVKHYLIDANSSDGTRMFLEKFVSANPDNSVLLVQDGTGLYAALNQAINAVLQDNDVTHIGFLHSDDRLIPGCFFEYLSLIRSSDADLFYSDIQFHNDENRVVRVWAAGTFTRLKLNTGWMPPHTSVIAARRIYERFGLFDSAFGTAADYEWLVRVLSSDDCRLCYHPTRTLSMSVGGASSGSLAARLRANSMDGSVWRNHSLLQAALIRLSKPLRKLFQFRIHH